MKTNQNGFSALIVILILIIIGLLGVGGWYFWSNQEDEQETTEPVATEQPEDSPSESSEPAEDTQLIPDGWVRYSNTEIGITFLYPQDWGEVVRAEFDDQGNSDYFGFSEFDPVSVGGLQADYEVKPRGGTLIDPGGFSVAADGAIQFQNRDGSVAGPASSEYTLVDGDNCIMALGTQFFDTLAYHATCNTPSDVTPGFNFAAQDSSLVDVAVFEQMVESYEVL